MVALPDGEKCENMCTRFDTIHERDGWTDTALRHWLCYAYRHAAERE